MSDIFKGSTSHSIFIELVDSTTGLPKTGILYTDVTGSYCRTRAARTAITMATLASASAGYSSGGFILEDDTNQPGVYRVDVPDAAFATGAEEVVLTIKATGCRTVSRAFNLVDVNNQRAYVPDVASGGVGGLLTAPATANTGLSNVTQLHGTAWLTPGTAGTPDVNAKLIGGTVQTAGDVFAGLTTVAARIGAFTGTGINTILGFLRALFSKGAGLTPSDLTSGGLTGDNTTDSLEALADAIGDIDSGGTIQNNIVIPAAVAAESQVTNLITAIRGDTLRRSFVDLGDISTRSSPKVWFTIKTDHDDADSAAVIQITETGGLITLNGAAAPDSSKGSIVVTDEDTGDVTIYIDETIMSGMVLGQKSFDIQWKSAADTTTPVSGKFVVVRDVTNSVS